ncbi:hypothetical protein D3C77_581100 [compost metagenome]
MQQHSVMAGLGNRQVEARIGRTLLGPTDFVGTRVTVLQGIEGGLEALAIRFGCPDGGVIGAGRFQRVAKLQQIALSFRIAFEQLQQRIAEGRPQ